MRRVGEVNRSSLLSAPCTENGNNNDFVTFGFCGHKKTAMNVTGAASLEQNVLGLQVLTIAINKYDT